MDAIREHRQRQPSRLEELVGIFVRRKDPGLSGCQQGIVTVTGSGGQPDPGQGWKEPRDPHRRHRFPAELISHAVWLRHVFSLSFRDVELLLPERGILIFHESIRRWCLKLGASFTIKSSPAPTRGSVRPRARR